MESSNFVKPLFHCNNCLELLKLFDEAPSTGRRGERVLKQYLTECSHVLCQNCRVKSNTNCIQCNRPTKFMEISKKMPKQFQLYFENANVTQMLLANILQFQQNQFELITQKMNDKQEQLEQKCAEALKEAEIAENEWKDQQEEMEKIKIIFHRIVEEKR